MVYRIFVEKKPAQANEAKALLHELQTLLGLSQLTGLRLFNRYDVEGVSEALFSRCVTNVFSEPPVDDVYEVLPEEGAAAVFAVESLPGQFDQRADSASQCIQLISQGERPLVRAAKVYMLFGAVDEAALAAVKQYVINPVESREASLAPVETLKAALEAPEGVETLAGFTELDEAGLLALHKRLGLAMDLDDLLCCQKYFQTERRDPTITEVRVLDTYWSDHCRHTTFGTQLTDIAFDHPRAAETYARYQAIRNEMGVSKPVTLMDMATRAAKYLKQTGQLQRLDESDEINACTVKIDVETDEGTEPWLLLFKNETHNHPTEIEPFGGAATCIGGAIRDPLSGRAYVYQAMRVTGAADPLRPVSETLAGKLPQRKLVTTAAAGYSSYGNQIGLATGLVDEIYHEGYAAKRMEIGAVVGAVPEKNVRRETPAPGDVVILLGGRTGRDGCGGATGSSKSHNTSSIETCGAEVQKGNAPEERKLQRLFRNPEAARLIKRCNDFGAGGVSVAVGELAESLRIDLNAVPKKYEGLDGTELAISESQERMAVVVAAADAERFAALAKEENLESTIVATVTDDGRMTMDWKGKRIVDLSRAFLNTNGAPKKAKVRVSAPKTVETKKNGGFAEAYLALAADLNVCSKRGLAERFDSTIGAGSVLMPFGGKRQRTPAQAMAAKIPVLHGDTSTCSVMAWGFDPFVSACDPYCGAYTAVAQSVAKVIAAGAPLGNCYLTFQEYFEKLGDKPERWGKPAAALLGAFAAQLDLGIGAIGGKDSMSGSFNDIDVPPTLVSFAISTGDVKNVISPEFKRAGAPVYRIAAERAEDGMLDPESLRACLGTVERLIREGRIVSAYVCGQGGMAEAVLKMSLGNGFGFAFEDGVTEAALFEKHPLCFVVEAAGDALAEGTLLGHVSGTPAFSLNGVSLPLAELEAAYEGKLEPVFACNIPMEERTLPAPGFAAASWPKPRLRTAAARALIPVFPGTNCEYDTARAFERAGIAADVLVLRNLTANDVAEAAAEFARRAQQGQIIFIPGGFSGGDEPDGSGKLITAFFRNPRIRESVDELLKNRDGLMCGVCNGFQALIKLGLIPYGEIRDADAQSPTLTYNVIGRHQSKIVRTRVCSNKSPWLMRTVPDEIYSVPVSHGEGRILCSEAQLQALAENGQIATQYVDPLGQPTLQVQFNPNGSAWAVEGLTSPDGRVLGKMGHSERIGTGLYKNVEGRYDMQIFASAADYFKI